MDDHLFWYEPRVAGGSAVAVPLLQTPGPGLRGAERGRGIRVCLTRCTRNGCFNRENDYSPMDFRGTLFPGNPISWNILKWTRLKLRSKNWPKNRYGTGVSWLQMFLGVFPIRSWIGLSCIQRYDNGKFMKIHEHSIIKWRFNGRKHPTRQMGDFGLPCFITKERPKTQISSIKVNPDSRSELTRTSHSSKLGSTMSL